MHLEPSAKADKTGAAVWKVVGLHDVTDAGLRGEERIIGRGAARRHGLVNGQDEQSVLDAYGGELRTFFEAERFEPAAGEAHEWDTDAVPFHVDGRVEARERSAALRHGIGLERA
jgi:hypothetical protein